ncbi:hypothetical protein HPP92_026572 [Vanilla planifolia]|uniref:Uncharacterized protein n=1 Tax=Vanilla planifolia TaxID=51239 RepID=A0A835PBT2_VANPL|nr:hypothetical protein HPP92_026572 [Vanilla planifolia]
MGEALLTYLAMDDYHLSTFLSMKPTFVGTASMATSHVDGVLEPLIQQRQQMACRIAPDINLPSRLTSPSTFLEFGSL